MYVDIWEYRVESPDVQEFLDLYGPDGAWVKLFGRPSGYIGTDLLRDREDATRFVTIDRWATSRSHAEFRAVFATQYEALDASCEEVTSSEQLLGHFDVE